MNRDKDIESRAIFCGFKHPYAKILHGCLLQVCSSHCFASDAWNGASGIALIDGARVISVHDIKPRVSEGSTGWLGIFDLPESKESTLSWRQLHSNLAELFPVPRDVESVSLVPGTSSILIGESGVIGINQQRLFQLVEVGSRWEVTRVFDWPWPVSNTEGMEVCRVGDHDYFVSAERSDGASFVDLVWSRVDTTSWRFAQVFRTRFSPPGLEIRPGQRLISALSCDEGGSLYGAAAFDPGNDSGPFRSVVFEIGSFQSEGDSSELKIIHHPPYLIIPGFKVEGLVVSKGREGAGRRVLLATDDEGMGGTIRWVNLPPATSLK
jgi:hypothetical protein